MPTKKKRKYSAKVVDLFCGIGGLTHGFVRESFDVAAGYDIDTTCKYAFEKNNNAAFIDKNITKVTGTEIKKHFGNADVKILVGCAPCQPFSTYSYKTKDKDKWTLLYEFARLIEEAEPDIVSMENVPRLTKFDKASVFSDFLEALRKKKYHKPYYEIVNCPDYGIPQYRKRLVLLASRFGEIQLIPKTHTKENYETVESAIGKMEPLESGGISETDDIHRAAKLSELNLKRVRQSKPGGTWRDWDDELRLKCHRKKSGETYVSVYGRMNWKEPAPTMTTHCVGIGNGRFGHPEQDRAITLREAALFQTFPLDYEFVPKGQYFKIKTLSTHIGNAVPVKLGQVIAQSIEKHLDIHFR